MGYMLQGLFQSGLALVHEDSACSDKQRCKQSTLSSGPCQCCTMTLLGEVGKVGADSSVELTAVFSLCSSKHVQSMHCMRNALRHALHY